MGASTSKPTDSEVSIRSNSLRRSPIDRLSGHQGKSFQIENTSKIITNLKNEIDMFQGDRQSARYKEFQTILTTLAGELQGLKNSTKKQQNRDRCDEVQGQIQNCLQRLETKVYFNEQNEISLDLAAVESHSFINQSFNNNPDVPKPVEEPANKQRPYPKFESIKSLDSIEQETANLEKEIKKSLELEDTKQFVIYENKIKILYTDLELIHVDDHTPLGEKKASIGKRLIKSNNQIKRFKRNLERKQKQQVEGNKTQLDDFGKFEQTLEKLEIQALTFDGVKGDKKYKELEQVLESHWTQIYSMDAFGAGERKRKSLTIERAKNILQELRKRAEENEKQTEAIRNIHKVEKQFNNLKKEVENFQGTSIDEDYIRLDQDLRTLWAELRGVEEANEHIKRTKSRVINDIQFVLKNFSEGSRKRESVLSINEEILQRQLLKQLEEFQNHWNQLNYNFEVNLLNKSDKSKEVVEVLNKIIDGINKKINALELLEKRKSTSSLVITKMLDTSSLERKYQTNITAISKTYQPPDLLQEQITPSASTKIETEIKVQPTVKVIGEMQRVSTEAKVLSQQIRQSNCLKHDKEYKIFEKKLLQCQETLQAIEYNKSSDTIESNKRRAAKIIAEAFRTLEGKNSPKSTCLSQANRSLKAQEVMDIDAEIQYFHQQIKQFTGVTKDQQYEKIKHGLEECLNKLQMIDVNLSKQESIQQIQQYHLEFERKLAENQAKVKVAEIQTERKRSTSNELKGIIESVQKSKLQIERFTGPYEGLLYKQIEDNLKYCFERLNGLDITKDDKLENAKLQTNEKIEKYLNILENKSTKTSITEETPSREQKQNVMVENLTKTETTELPSAQDVIRREKIQRQSRIIDAESPHHHINSLRDKLVVIKDKTETFTGKYQDPEYTEVEKELFTCFEELKGIDDKGHKSVIISKEQYEEYIVKLLNYFKEKCIEENTAEATATGNFTIVDPTEKLAVIQGETKAIKEKLDAFTETIDDGAIYNDYEQSLTSLMVDLGTVNAGNVAHVRERKRKLAEELENCVKVLDGKRANRAEWEKDQVQLRIINNILQELEGVSKEVNAFIGVKNDKKYCYLDEVLIRMTIQLDASENVTSIKVRDVRNRAIKDIQKNMNILKERATSKPEVYVVSQV